MFSNLLATKLFVSPVRLQLVSRPRLNEGLATEGDTIGRKSTLVSVPAGLGKSTLLSTWLSESDHTSARLALDEAIKDPLGEPNFCGWSTRRV